jgi:hypothetical protein
VRFIDGKQCACVRGEFAESSVEAWPGQQEAGVGHRRLGQHDGDIPRREGAVQRSGVVKRDYPRR